MDLNLYSFIPIILCILLAAAVVVLAFRLKKINRKNTSSTNITEEEKEILKSIEEGLKNNEFKMYLQFIVDNQTKHISSADALSRWENKAGEIVPPGKYIGLMEKFGLITHLDYYMFEKACKKLSEWNGSEFDSLTVSCNFTRITISENDFVRKIQEIADKYSFDRSKLLIEITEDSIEKNMAAAISNIIRVKELGFKIALDDVGSGYTSLINLCEYPIDVVKIDRELLMLTEGENGKKLFLGILSLIHYLNIKAVCEGVETDVQNDLVSSSECDYIQGWYYFKALPEAQAEENAKGYMDKIINNG